MKKHIIINALVTALLLCVCGLQRGYSQGSFINLNFESAVIVLDHGSPFYPHAVFSTNALPGWIAYTYGTPQTVILYDSQSLGAAAVAIYDTNDLGENIPLEGRYSVGLNGQDPGTASNQTAAIAQTGQIPTGTKSLTFYAILGNLQISFNGQAVPFTTIGGGANYTVYGGDISAFAGQTGELRFTTPIHSSAAIDNIQFSSSPIPEPGVISLSALGILLLGFFRRRNSSR